MTKKHQRLGGEGSFQALIKLYDAIIFIRDISPLTLLVSKPLEFEGFKIWDIFHPDYQGTTLGTKTIEAQN